MIKAEQLEGSDKEVDMAGSKGHPPMGQALDAVTENRSLQT